MQGICAENTFVISLAERSDRLVKCRNGLYAHGINHSVWTAIKDKDGKLGLIKTMKEVFEYFMVKKFDRLLIFEDDAKILSPDFFNEATSCIEQLPKDFDLLYFGCNLSGQYLQYKRHSANLLSGQGMYASHAVLYSRKAIEKILPLLYIHDAYDKLLVKEIQPYGSSFCSYPLLVTQENGFSNIEGKNVNYERFIDKRFVEKTKDL